MTRSTTRRPWWSRDPQADNTRDPQETCRQRSEVREVNTAKQCIAERHPTRLAQERHEGKQNSVTYREASDKGLPWRPLSDARTGNRQTQHNRDDTTKPTTAQRLTQKTWEQNGLKPIHSSTREQSSNSKNDMGREPPRSAVPPTRPPPPGNTNHKKIFFQTHSFEVHTKAAQRKEFFKKVARLGNMPTGQLSWPPHRRDGTAGRAPLGVTKADTDLRAELSNSTRQARLREKID